MTRIDGSVMEYACHEGNYGLANILSGARAEERGTAAGVTIAISPRRSAVPKGCRS